MAIAIFDLDNTLLNGDSDYAWGVFACEQGLVDAARFAQRNEAFYQDYQAGSLEVHAYLRHALSPLAGQTTETAWRWHEQFMREKIDSMILSAAQALVEQHRRQGHQLLVITSTNRYIAEPIVRRFGIADLIASECEIRDGRYTGEPHGEPSFGEGKVNRLREWLSRRKLNLSGSCFYSDSHNDLPLLSLVDKPVAVDPDPILRGHAIERGWPVISLRE